jgi:hypothetical protein
MKALSLLLFFAFLLPVQTPQQSPATPAQREQNPPEQPAADTDTGAVPIISEATYRGWCSTRLESGPVVDEETFKKIQAGECFPLLRKLAVDFSKQSLIAYRVHGDCNVRGGIKIVRNDRLKKYTLSVTKYFGGCRAAGSFEGWVVIEKLRPDYAIESIERTVDEHYQ